VAFDPEHRLVLGVVSGKRSATKILKLLKTVKQQLQGRVPRLVTSDEFSSYATVLKRVWPRKVKPKPDKRCTRRHRPCTPQKTKPHSRLNYATVCKQRKKGRVVSVRTRVVMGTSKAVAAALQASNVSSTINTSFLERHNGTDRHRNARKVRRTYRFSKNWATHEAAGFFSYYTYNFCWCVRTLSKRLPGETSVPRTPAMAAGLATHVWSLEEWLKIPIAGLSN
jgi:IS1 family transposase